MIPKLPGVGGAMRKGFSMFNRKKPAVKTTSFGKRKTKAKTKAKAKAKAKPKKKGVKRTFKIVGVKQGNRVVRSDGGRYVSKTPSGAARKMHTQMCRRKKTKGVCTFTITLRETTSGSSKKEYAYRAKRTRLRVPIELGNRTINYATKLTSVKK